MRRIACVATLALALAASLTTAMAGTISKTVPAGRAAKLDHYTGWKDDCSFTLISINITSKPAHGSISTRIAKGRIGDAQIGSAGSCAGRPTKVLELYYKSARGYHGSDSLAVSVSVGGRSTTYYYDVSVQ